MICFTIFAVMQLAVLKLKMEIIIFLIIFIIINAMLIYIYERDHRIKFYKFQ